MPGTVTSSDPGAVQEGLALLQTLADERVPPREALDRLAQLRTRHPGLRLDLVWDVEPYDGAVHYDLLVRDGARTLSLSLAPRGDDLPWPLRGAQRVGDTVLLEVDGERLEVGEAVQVLDTWEGGTGGVAEALVDACLLRAEVAARVAALSPEEAQAAVARVRAAKGLEGDDALAQWCRLRAVGVEEFERTALTQVVVALLRRDGLHGASLPEWLRRRRAEASVRWFWSVADAGGTAGRTGTHPGVRP